MAARLATAGYAIQHTAIFKIEKGKPPRRVTVDELVGFSKVLDVPVDELLLPMELIKNQRAIALAEELSQTDHELSRVAQRLHDLYVEYFQMAIEEPEEVRQYFHDLVFRRTVSETPAKQEGPSSVPDGVAEAGQNLVVRIMDAAQSQVIESLRGGGRD
jgi:transcriptional regulator with XRE-family HTH domain